MWYCFVSLNYEYCNDSLVLQLHFERRLIYGSWNKQADTIGTIAACTIAHASVCNFPPKIVSFVVGDTTEAIGVPVAIPSTPTRQGDVSLIHSPTVVSARSVSRKYKMLVAAV